MLTNTQNGIIRKKIDGDFEEIWKRLLWKSPDGVILSWNSPVWLAERYGLDPHMEIITKINALLERLANSITAH